MSLVYDLTKIEDWKSICYYQSTKEMKITTQTIIFMMPLIDQREIMSYNAGEVWARIKVYQKLLGAISHDSELKDIILTPEDIINHIGLITNVKARTRHQWLARVVSDHMTEETYVIERLLEEGTTEGLRS